MTTIFYPEYAQYEKLIYSAIHAVHRQLGGDLDEMISCAGILFVKACQTYNPTRGKTIGAWIRKVVWDDTFSARRVDIGRKKRYESEPVDLIMIAERQRFNLSEFVEELSEDARNLVALALDPIGVQMKMGDTPKRNSLFAVAKRLYHWTDEQLNETVQEIAECLT